MLMFVTLTNFASFGPCLLSPEHYTVFHEYQFSGSRVVPCGRMDKRGEYQSGFPQLLRKTHSVKCRKTY